MGKTERPPGLAEALVVPFTPTQVADRELVLRMLRFEDVIIHSERGANIYRRQPNSGLTDLHPEKAIHRVVLVQFKFNTSDESVETYRTIFAHYYRSPTDYDAEVMQAVTYMRENRTVFYTADPVVVGSPLPDAPLLTLGDGVATSVSEQLSKKEFKYAFIGAFSTS